MKDNWKDDLFSEKSLRQAYLVSRSLARSRFNWWALRICAVLLIGVSIFWVSRHNVSDSFIALTALAQTGFDLTVQILGFLIGGFAIFATISDSRLMVRLAQTKMKDSDLSVFKTIFYNFISVFYIYVVTLSLSVGIKVGSTLNVVDARWFQPKLQPYILASINAVAFVFVGVFVTLSILRLKSFIWNIYQAFLTFLIVGEITRGHSAENPEGNGG